MNKKLILIMGPQSSGNKMTTNICAKLFGYEKILVEDLTINCPTKSVLQLSTPTGAKHKFINKKWVNVESLFLFIKNECKIDDVIILCPVRDFETTTKSLIKMGNSRQEAIALHKKALKFVIDYLLIKNNFHWVSYEFLTGKPNLYISELAKRIKEKINKEELLSFASKIINQNLKWYEATDAKNFRGFEFLTKAKDLGEKMLIKKEEIHFVNTGFTEDAGDPNRLFIYKEKLYRLIQNSNLQKGRWEAIQEFCESVEFERLMESGYVPNYLLTEYELEGYTGDIYFVQELPFCTSYKHRSSEQILDCCKLICKINLLLSSLNSEYRLSDAHGDQFLFYFSTPVCVDIGSFSKKHENWAILSIEAMLKRLNVKNKFSLSQGWNNILSVLNKIKLTDKKETWSDYGGGNLPISSDKILIDSEAKLIMGFINQKDDIKTIIDIGCNKGRFSRVFAKNGKLVFAIDNTESVINELHKNTKLLNLTIGSANIDVTKEEPTTGYLNWKNRIISDLVFCSSITHHLHRSGFNFKKQASLWSHLSTKYLIVEYIDTNDIHVSRWEVEKDYTKEEFENSLLTSWNIIEIKPSTSVGRYWYFLEKKIKSEPKVIWR